MGWCLLAACLLLFADCLLRSAWIAAPISSAHLGVGPPCPPLLDIPSASPHSQARADKGCSARFLGAAKSFSSGQHGRVPRQEGPRLGMYCLTDNEAVMAWEFVPLAP